MDAALSAMRDEDSTRLGSGDGTKMNLDMLRGSKDD